MLLLVCTCNDRYLYSHLPSEADCASYYYKTNAAIESKTGMAKDHAQFCKDFWWAAWWVTWTSEGTWHGQEVCGPGARKRYSDKMRQMIGEAAYRNSQWPK